MANVFRKKGRKSWHYKIKMADGTWSNALSGFPDKQATEALRREKQKEQDQIAAGLMTAQSKAPIDDLVAEYLDDLKHVGRSESHLYSTRRWLRILKEELGWKTLESVRPDGLKQYLQKLRESGKAARSINAPRDAAVAFVNWCVTQEYIDRNPLTKIRKASGGKKQLKRAYTLAEFRQLLALENDRKLIYLTLGLGGYRVSEVKRMTREDLDPNLRQWKLRPEFDKSGKRHLLPMSSELASAIAPTWEKLRPGEKLFKTWPARRTFNLDLKRAKIDKTDELGRTVDIHSFRRFFCIQLARRLPIQDVKKLMRHASIRMTADVYSALEIEDYAESQIQVPTLLDQ